MTPRPEHVSAVLSAYLWDLRTHIEAQLRHVTDAQRRLDTMRREPGHTAEHVSNIVADVTGVLDASVVVRNVATMALDLTRQ